ncbi:hypothetical protein LXL04_001047 [Taraxacum kok-saghyz]
MKSISSINRRLEIWEMCPRCSSTTAIDVPSSLSDGLRFGIRWDSAKFQGATEEMEDDAIVVANNEVDGFYFAAAFYGRGFLHGILLLQFLLIQMCGSLFWKRKNLWIFSNLIKQYVADNLSNKIVMELNGVLNKCGLVILKNVSISP